MKDISSASQFLKCCRESVVFAEYSVPVILFSLLLKKSMSADYHSLCNCILSNLEINLLEKLTELPSPLDGSLDGREIQ